MIEQHRAEHIVLLEHHRHDLLDRHASLVTIGRRVLGQRSTKVLSDADVVDDQTPRLVAERAIHAGDRLHQTRTPHGLVDVHRVHRGRVETGEPHVAHDHDLKLIVGVLRPALQVAQVLFRMEMGLELRHISRRTGHHNLDLALHRIIRMPFRSHRHNPFVQRHTDAP